MSSLKQISDIISEYYIEFKTQNEKDEWHSGNVNPKLISIINILSMICFSLFNKIITITEVFRTQEENDKIYGWTESNNSTRPISVHTYWRGVDIRTFNFKKSEIEIIVNILNSIPYKKIGNIKTAVYGDKRHLDHIHIQVSA